MPVKNLVKNIKFPKKEEHDKDGGLFTVHSTFLSYAATGDRSIEENELLGFVLLKNLYESEIYNKIKKFIPGWKKEHLLIEGNNEYMWVSQLATGKPMLKLGWVDEAYLKYLKEQETSKRKIPVKKEIKKKPKKSTSKRENQDANRYSVYLVSKNSQELIEKDLTLQEAWHSTNKYSPKPGYFYGYKKQ